VRARAVAVRAALSVLAAAAAVWAAQRYMPVFVGGGSMAPALASGDLAIVRRGSEAVRTGDIVLVAKPGWPRGVLHRVDAVMSDGTLRLRGDANPVADRDLAALERLVRRWYNPASQPKSEATTERRGREHAPPVQRGAPWLEGLRGGEHTRFTPTAAFLKRT
jgi:Peptidase S24-like